MADLDGELEASWRRGHQALEAALGRLERLSDSAAKREALDLVARGSYAEAIMALSVIGDDGAVARDLRTAIEARNYVITLAWQRHGAHFKAMARRFRRARRGEDNLSAAWERALRNMFRWQQTGEYKAWLAATLRNALRDDIRAGDREDAKVQRYAAEAVVPAAAPGIGDPSEPTTTIAGAELALRSFKAALGPDKRALWDGWTRLAGEGMSAEEIYVALAEESGRSSVAVKGAVLRLQAEFRELVGGSSAGVVDASRTLALWVGSERSGAESAVLATAIDVDDNLRLLAMRRVRHVNQRAFARIFETLTRWRLPARVLVIVDDSEGAREAVHEQFTGLVPVQRCIDSIVRVLADALPPELAKRSAQAAERALRLRSAAQAESKLGELAASLRAGHPRAAAIVDEALAEGLTVKRLGLPASLEEQMCRVRFLASPARASASPFGWLSGVFDGLRQRRSVERRRAGLQALAATLGPGEKDQGSV